MKIRQALTLILLGQLAISFSASANVKFIVDDSDTDINNSKSQNTLDDKYHEACKSKGFAVAASSCTGSTIPGLSCPHNPNYVDKCCDRKYRYVVNSGACSHNATPSSDICGGRFACICDSMTYPKGIDRELCTGKFAYDEINYCTESYVDDKGVEHETRYFKGCTCAPNYARCNSSYHLHGTGDSCSYNGNIYYTSCSCDAGYNKLCSVSGAKDSKDYCLFNRKKYYRECNETETDDKTDDTTMESTEQ